MAQDLLKVLQMTLKKSAAGRWHATAVTFGMEPLEFVIALLPTIGVGIVCVVALRRRRRGSPLITNPYTLAIEPNADNHGSPPIVRPMPSTTTSEPLEPYGRDYRE